MKITITKREFQQFQIYNYFDAPNRIIKFMRMYMGPVLVLIALYLLYSQVSGINNFILGFLLAYGLFYTAKPLIMIWAVKAQDETLTFKLKENKLYVKDRKNEEEFDLKETKLHENKKYFFIKLNNNQALFFPKEKLSEEKILEFRENL